MPQIPYNLRREFAKIGSFQGPSKTAVDFLASVDRETLELTDQAQTKYRGLFCDHPT